VARALAGVLVALVVAAALVVATRREAAVDCTVCMEFGGRSACRTAHGAEREATLRGAARGACAVLASGVTLGLECDRTPPRSAECSD
jgi:membrane-associated PAP2 superfamily phosphatase